MDDYSNTPSDTGMRPTLASARQDATYKEHEVGAGDGASMRFPHHILQLVAKALQATQAVLGLVSPEGDIQKHIVFGMEDDLALELQHSSWGSELIRFILHRGVPLKVSDFRQDLPAQGVPPFLVAQPPLKIGPFLGVPLLGHGRCRGALYLVRAPGEPPFSDQDLETVLPVRTWLGLENFFEGGRLLAQFRLLNQVAQAAAGPLELPQILSIVLRELDRHLPQYTCAIWLLDDAEQEAMAESQQKGAPGETPFVLVLNSYGLIPNERATKLGLTAGLHLPLERTRFAACLRSGQAQYVDLARPEPHTGGNSTVEDVHSPFEVELRQRGATSSFAVPLRAGDQAVGVLHSICTRAIGFTNEQIQLLYLVADLVGPAISNCQHVRRLRAAYEQLRTTHNQLLQAEKMRALGELAGGMAHDFNNSLCGVLGFLELALADKGLDPTIGGYLESARTCTLDAAQTVRRVQNFARWQRNDLSIQLLNFNELVRQTLELTRHKWESLAHARGIPITVQTRADAKEWISGSAAELREVITNLVFNAVDAMPEGGQLSVTAWSSPTDIYLSVGDTGTGMSPSTRRRLFEPFFTTKGERGNGLGLSVTFGIVQRYGGEITVESELGRGSRFTVRLPLKSRERETSGKREQPDLVGPLSKRNTSLTAQAMPAAPGRICSAVLPQVAVSQEEASVSPLVEVAGVDMPTSAKPKSLHILVIEDEDSIRRFLTKALIQLGHSSRTTADAKEGLAAFSEERFDLVFTDLGLPGVSGEEVARTIATKSPATPVILLTGWSDQLKDEAQPLIGVTHILGKPITLSTLSSVLAAVCQQQER